MYRPLIMISSLAALVITGLGGFLIYRYGEAERIKGYTQCLNHGAALATEAARQLNETLTKPIKNDDVDKLLLINGWMRDQNDE